MITLKQQKFSQSDPVLILQFSKQSQFDPVFNWPKFASALIRPLLISAARVNDIIEMSIGLDLDWTGSGYDEFC